MLAFRIWAGRKATKKKEVKKKKGLRGEEERRAGRGRQTDHLEVFFFWGRNPGENEKESLRKKKRKV